MKTFRLIRGLISSLLMAAMIPSAAIAQDITLRLHQFLPPQAVLPSKVLVPWAEQVEAASDGRIEIDHFDAMSLGGRPPELIDQARDGVVDVVMTVVGYTPGRFPRSEVFELPFMMTDPVATASAYWEMVETDFQENDFKDLKILGAWVHGPGVIHSRTGINNLDDMRGKTLRGPTRVINEMLSELGATPIGLPVPGIPEALSKGVIDGTVIPWEVTLPLRLPELVEHHTEFSGSEALYTATFVLAMNKARYEAMSDDLKAILDAKSGASFSSFAAQVMVDFDAPGRESAERAGNKIVTLDLEEVARWKEASKPVVARWVSEMEDQGIDGTALIEEARKLIKKHGG